MAEREITGRHVLLGMVGAFGVIITVNVVMAWQAVSTFPGLEVKNSYVASQTFDAERKAQLALGWVLLNLVLLLVLVRVGERRWRAAGLDLDGRRTDDD